MWWINSLFILLLIICFLTDVKRRKIYNKIIFPGILFGLLAYFIMNGWNGLLFSLMGLGIGFALLLIPYFLGGMGAGDVKFLALVGAMKGTVFVLETSIYMGLIGGIIALYILLFKQGRLAALWSFILTRKAGVKTSLLLDKKNKTYPYGVAIAVGALITLIFNGNLLQWL